MPKSDSLSGTRQYRLTKCISRNALSQAWIAQRSADGAVCFVKTINSDSDLGAALQDAVLAESFRCQHDIRHRRITTASALVREGGRLFVEYPYLDPTRWQPLDAATLARRPRELLAEVALLIDYLHRLNLVHCDLKLSNFLIREGGEDSEIRLVDLDFLCPAGTRPKARVFGTPDHIAPEILHNDEIYRQSDTYSLGVSLRLALSEAPFDKRMASSLERLVAAMTVDDPLLRPRTLTAALADHDLIEESHLGELSRRLLAMALVTRCSQADRTKLGDRGRIEALLADVGLLGLDPAVIELLARSYGANRVETVRLFRQLVAEATVQPAADYFAVSLPDDRLLVLMNKLGARAGLESIPRDRPIRDFINQARTHADGGMTLWGYLALQEVLRDASAAADGPSGDITEGWGLLAQSAGALGRMQEAAGAWQTYAERLAPDDPARFDALYQEARSKFVIGRVDEAEILSRTLLAAAQTRGDAVQEVTVRRILGMIDLYRGTCDVDDLVRRTITEVAERIPSLELALSHYTVGDILIRKGELARARDHVHRALELARYAGAMERLPMILVELVEVLKDLGDQHGARHYATAGVRLAQRSGDTQQVPHFMASLLQSCSRLGLRAESEFWDSKLQVALHRVNNVGTVLYYAVGIGFARMQRGDLRGGKEFLLKTLERRDVYLRQERWKHKVLENLAECAYWQGDSDLCEKYLAEGQAIVRKTDDQGTAAELASIAILNRIYNRSDRDLKPLHAVLDRLLERRANYFALRCAYHLILLDADRRQEVMAKIAPVLETVSGSAVPLFRTLEGLASVVGAKRFDPMAFLQELKDGFRVLVRGGQKFLAAVTGYRIAEQYLSDGRDALGQKYLTEVARIADSLQNKRLHQEVTERIALLRKSTESHRRLLQSIHGISQVLRNMGEYEDSLTRLVEFAVNETGAERGAMLLRSPRSSEFFVAAYYNCDEGSLGDITDISSRVPLDASRQLKPLVIDDATVDDRTKEYRSVIEHNILSVICVPIVRDGETVGALYLDHHTIPALFEPDDITYIMAIANFMALVITSLRQYRSVAVMNRELLADLNRADGGEAFVTGDAATLEMLKPLGEIALSDRPVLILGESGTGKGVLARKIHDMSRRAGKQLVQFNSSTVAETMIESELFGIVRGAATGVSEREGKFMAADGGTLFFDEIGDMPLIMQAKILTAVETQRFERVGSNRTVWVDVRFIYATNKDLQTMIDEGTFRQDLYQRMNFFAIEIPPLRSRPADIPLLIDHFVRNLCRERPAPKFSRAAMEALVAYSWPGNVRVLEILVERFCIVHPGKEIGVSLLPRDIQNVRSNTGPGREVAKAVEKARMAEALEKQDGNISRAARDLGVPLSTFRRRARKYGLI